MGGLRSCCRLGVSFTVWFRCHALQDTGAVGPLPRVPANPSGPGGWVGGPLLPTADGRQERGSVPVFQPSVHCSPRTRLLLRRAAGPSAEPRAYWPPLARASAGVLTSACARWSSSALRMLSRSCKWAAVFPSSSVCWWQTPREEEGGCVELRDSPVGPLMRVCVPHSTSHPRK